MIKVAANASDREGLMRLVEIFKAKVVDVTRESLTLTITGDVEKVSAMVELMQDFGIPKSSGQAPWRCSAATRS